MIFGDLEKSFRYSITIFGSDVIATSTGMKLHQYISNAGMVVTYSTFPRSDNLLWLLGYHDNAELQVMLTASHQKILWDTWHPH